jgi:hypothetical protein
MSGMSAVVSEVWCYTRQEDVVESAVRAVMGSVKGAASQWGASVWVWTKEETQKAIDNLKAHLGGIEVGKITEPAQKKADVYVEVRVEKGVVAAWRVHVHRTQHVASAVKEEPATVEDELKAAKKVIEKLHEDVKEVVQMVQEREEELAKRQAELEGVKNALEVAAAEIKRLSEQLKTEQAERELRGVEVGKQTWTAENLDVGEYGDGEEIKEARSDEAWIRACAAEEGAWCYHPDNEGNAKKWGKLYNQYALKKLCPRGWRFPTHNDWVLLFSGDAKKLTNGPFKAVVPDGRREGVPVKFSTMTWSSRWLGLSQNTWPGSSQNTEGRVTTFEIDTRGGAGFGVLLLSDASYRAIGIAVRLIKV